MTIDINIVINAVVSMFLVMAVGYFMRKYGIIDADFSKKLSKLILYVTQPVLIFSSLSKMAYSAENTRMMLTVLAISVFTHIFAALLAWISMKVLKDKTARKLSEHGIIFSNCMFFGLPITKSLYGASGEFWTSVFSVIFNIFVWTYGIILLGRERDDIKLNIRKVFLNFGSVPCVLGILFYFLNINIPVAVSTSMGYIGSMCTPLSLLVLGGVLATVPLKRLFNDMRIYYVCFVKLIALPLLVFVVVKYVARLDEVMCMFSLIMAGLPTASMTNSFAELYDMEPGYAARLVGMTTVFAVGTLPLIVYIGQLI